MLILDLPEDVQTRLQLLSMRTGRTMVYYAMEALLEHLDEIENHYEVIRDSATEIEKNENRVKVEKNSTQ